MNQPQLLTVDELAFQLRVTPKAIHMMRYRGTGPPAIRVGRKLLFDVDDVSTWLESRREEPHVQ